MKAQDFASVYHFLCSRNRCYFFLILRCLSLQTSGFPLVCQVVLPQHCAWQDVVVPPKIRVWSIFFVVIYLLLIGVHLHVETRPDPAGILYLHSCKNYTSSSFIIHFVICQYLSGSVVLCQFCLPWTLLQEVFPLKRF